MNYAFWIAILVVFIAVAPAIFSNLRRSHKGGGKSSGDAGPTATSTSDRDRDDGDAGDSDGGGGDGGGGD
ncbi:hypothetical protein [Novosphingobium ginsenosidimutans]|uniref:Uncharacterized protein n=1 Tax=Novosphingobium ginsenosidimutans TaxID=1176536 RepID=A0A5B8S4M2_9SPHN|nr:hypothetical protein [Novosphingobium ginsenosidimutans]QEA16022.1 hypothetical protein FRF71_07670 [Novosphingobium ginsenosidimutans]